MIHSQPVAAMSSSAMAIIAALLEQHTGQEIAANRTWRIETALKPILRAMGLDTLDALATALVGSGGPMLAEKVVDALLNQETSFFRDGAVLLQMAEALRALQQQEPERRLRVWSAGCATGQEPLSLAMLFDELGMKAEQFPEIIASDISPSALMRASSGRYSQFEIQRGLPIRRMLQWFDEGEDHWVAKPELVRRVRYRRHNLAADPAPPGKFDAVLCRNVLLYFSLPLRRRVFETLAAALRPGGLLVLGAGETVIGQTKAFVPSQHYRGFYCLAGRAASGDVIYRKSD